MEEILEDEVDVLIVEGVRRLDLGTDRVDLTTTRPEALFAEITRLAVEEGVPVTEFQPTDESLEAVFRYLTK